MNFKEIKNFLSIYILAHGLVLLMLDVKFYDDIYLYSWDKKTLIDIYSNSGDYFSNRVYFFLFSKYFSPKINYLISFSLFFLSSISLYNILLQCFKIDKNTANLFILFYLTLPFGLSKFTVVALPYIVYLNIFLLAWLFMNKFRFLSLILFFISFNLQSLLVFYAVPISANYFLKTKKEYFKIRNLYNYFMNRIDFIILPFFYFVSKQIFFVPSGIMSNYNNNFTLFNLIKTPFLQTLDLFRNNLSLGFVIVGVLICFLIFIKIYNTKININKNFDYKIIIISLLASLFPYWILQLTPTFTGFGSRHQILMLLSFPFFIIYILNYINKKFQKTFIFLIVAVSLSLNWKIYFDYIIEGKKQNKLIEFIQENKKIFENENLIIMNDNVKNPTVTYYPLEHIFNNGIFKIALNNEKNFVIDITQFDDYLSGEFDYKFTNYYNASQHLRDKNNRIIILNIDSYGFLKFNFTILNENFSKLK